LFCFEHPGTGPNIETIIIKYNTNVFLFLTIVFPQFEFNRCMSTSYRPRGTYSIKDGMLILYVSEKESYDFTIDGDKLIFKRGDFIGDLVKEGAIFKFSDKE